MFLFKWIHFVHFSVSLILFVFVWAILHYLCDSFLCWVFFLPFYVGKRFFSVRSCIQIHSRFCYTFSIWFFFSYNWVHSNKNFNYHTIIFFCFQVLCKCFFMLRESSMKIKTLTISVFVLLFFFCKKNIYWNLIARNEHNANVNSFVIVEAKEIKRLFSFNWNQNHIKNSIAKKMSRSCFC